MARWTPDAESRLRCAAVELFDERGYDAVTVSDITERAGLTRRTFFRYFTDKREVLFAGSDRLPQAIEARLTEADATLPAPAAVTTVLKEVGTVLMLEVEGQQQRQRLIRTSAELQERERTKLAAVAEAIARGLASRNVAADDAALVGAFGAQLFRLAYERFLAADGRSTFDACIDTTVRRLADLVADLS